MSPNRPKAERVDILVEGDRIVEIGESLDLPDAQTVDLSGHIVIPGLINAHLHTWQSALRFLGADWTLPEYLHRVHGDVAAHYTPDDIYIGNLAGALNQINGGTTTLGDWCHNNRTAEHTDAAVDALWSKWTSTMSADGYVNPANGYFVVVMRATPRRTDRLTVCRIR